MQEKLSLTRTNLTSGNTAETSQMTLSFCPAPPPLFIGISDAARPGTKPQAQKGIAGAAPRRAPPAYRRSPAAPPHPPGVIREGRRVRPMGGADPAYGARIPEVRTRHSPPPHRRGQSAYAGAPLIKRQKPSERASKMLPQRQSEQYGNRRSRCRSYRLAGRQSGEEKSSSPKVRLPKPGLPAPASEPPSGQSGKFRFRLSWKEARKRSAPHP